MITIFLWKYYHSLNLLYERVFLWKKKQSFVKEIQSKHLITLSLGGVIGTGISLSSNYLIQEVGGVGTIIAYLIIALLPQEKAGLYESPFVIILTNIEIS